jgi:hypothetical protein
MTLRIASQAGKKVLLLEQNKLTSGTTWHAAGLIGSARTTMAETQLSLQGNELYAELESETGISTGYKRCGSLTLARTQERLTALQRTRARVESFGLPAQIVSTERFVPNCNFLLLLLLLLLSHFRSSFQNNCFQMRRDLERSKWRAVIESGTHSRGLVATVGRFCESNRCVHVPCKRSSHARSTVS